MCLSVCGRWVDVRACVCESAFHSLSLSHSNCFFNPFGVVLSSSVLF